MLEDTPTNRLRLARAKRDEKRAGAGPAVDLPAGAASDGAATHLGPYIKVSFAPAFLAADEPAALVFDDKGDISIDAPHETAANHRRRYCVGEVVELGAFGDALVASMFVRAVGNTHSAWKRYSQGARTFARALRELGLSAVGACDIPRDVFAQVEQWMRSDAGVAELGTGPRVALNTAKWLVGGIPECAHVDVTPDRVQGRRADWIMSGDAGGAAEPAPIPVSSTVWGDAETERLIKRCSTEVLTKVAGWNQFVAFLDDGAVGPGPYGGRELQAARALVRLNPISPPPSKSLTDGDLTATLLTMGWDVVRHWHQRAGDGVVPPPYVPGCIETMLRIGVDSRPVPASFKYGRGMDGFVKVGWTEAVRIAYPTAREMAPLAALLAIQSRLNPSPLGRLDDDEFGIVDEEARRTGPDGPDAARMRGAPYKGRSHRFYRVDFPVTFQPDDPAPLHEFLLEWTSRIRGSAGRYDGKLFIYIYDLYRVARVGSFANHEYALGFPFELEALCERAGVPRLTPRELRRIGLDIVHEACGGDMVTMKAAGDWRDLKTGELHYFGPSVVLRGQESLIWAAKIEARRLEHGIEVIGRPRGGDLFSATDGFACRNPLDGPDPQGPGEICHARALCAICPHGRLDVVDPPWTFAQLVTLAASISARLETGAEPDWVARYAPVLDELLELWLPVFPDAVVEQARRLPDIEMRELAH